MNNRLAPFLITDITPIYYCYFFRLLRGPVEHIHYVISWRFHLMAHIFASIERGPVIGASHTRSVARALGRFHPLEHFLDALRACAEVILELPGREADVRQRGNPQSRPCRGNNSLDSSSSEKELS